MKLLLVAVEGTTRFAVDEAGNWFASWCYGRFLPAFRYNPVPERLADLAHSTGTELDS